MRNFKYLQFKYNSHQKNILFQKVRQTFIFQNFFSNFSFDAKQDMRSNLKPFIRICDQVLAQRQSYGQSLI